MSPRKRLANFGRRGALVRVILLQPAQGASSIIVQWGKKYERGQQSFPHTRQGKIDAETFAENLAATIAHGGVTRLTNRQLWRQFIKAEVHLAKRTGQLYAAAWKEWELFAGPNMIAEATTVQQCADFRTHLDEKGWATATVQQTIRNVRTVFSWGERMELLQKNRWHLFKHKVARGKRTKQRAEYTQTEFLAIWQTLDPTNGLHWRAYVTLGFLGLYGSRQNEILGLQWSWVSEHNITIPLEFVKQGADDLVLPVFPQTRELLEIARAWAKRAGYTGPYVIFTGDRRGDASAGHYTIQSFWSRLQTAEKKAGVAKVLFRAGHAFRGMVVGDIIAKTGDVALALHAIGDRDLGMSKHYAKRRLDRVREALSNRAEGIQKGATKVQQSPDSPLATTENHSDDTVNPSTATA